MSKQIVHQMRDLPHNRCGGRRPRDGGHHGPHEPVSINSRSSKTSQPHSNRENVIWMQGDRPRAVKWRDWKFWYEFRVEPGDPNPDSRVRLFNLPGPRRRGETDVKDFNPWVLTVMDHVVPGFFVRRPRIFRCSRGRGQSLHSAPWAAERRRERNEATYSGTAASGFAAAFFSTGVVAQKRLDFAGCWSSNIRGSETPPFCGVRPSPLFSVRTPWWSSGLL